MEATLTDGLYHDISITSRQHKSIQIIHKEGTRDYHKKSNTPVQVDDFEKGEEVWTQAAGMANEMAVARALLKTVPSRSSAERMMRIQ